MKLRVENRRFAVIVPTVRICLSFAVIASLTAQAAFSQIQLARATPARNRQPAFPAAPAGSISAGFAREQQPAPDSFETLPPATMVRQGPFVDDSEPLWRPVVNRVYGGAEYLLLRMHFSEAIAFVTVTDSLQNGLPHEQAQARELNFGYNSAFRTYLGYHLSPGADLQFTYFHFGTSVAANGTSSSPAQFNIDAFGDRANFGQSIQTRANVQLNAFDFDFIKPMIVNRGCVGLRAAAGVRVADVRQSYGSSTYDALGNVMGVGTFATHFIGAGPHFGLQAQARPRPNSPFSLLARGAGSLLVGGYDVASGADFTGLGGAGQAASRTLTVPVIEAELGAAWQPTPSFTLSAGWLFQAWWDLGVSGGTTGGKFVQVDDSSIMAFDGLFTRAMFRY